MEMLPHYRQLIKSILSDLAELNSQFQAETLPLYDTLHDNYLLIALGWNGVHRIHHIMAHLRISNGKIWVEADNTDYKIVQHLLDADVPKDSIVLAFYSPQKRSLTEFAAG